jgi:deoxyxylulose-5-phosphate synthase
MLSKNDIKSKLKMVGIPDEFIEHAKPDIQKRLAGIDKDSIKKTIKKGLKARQFYP